MMLANDIVRVALATTHLPLREVADAITPAALETTLRILDAALRDDFGIAAPTVAVLGLNPHAGESGHLGREEIEILEPVLERLRGEGMALHGPLPTDTALPPAKLEGVDQGLAIEHDQGRPVRQYRGVGGAAHQTLRLAAPTVAVLGHNPHAGESGHLGPEDIEIIEPVLERLRGEGMALHGPLPADTAFLPAKLEGFDAVLAMYHDQGLPVLKYSGFERAVNLTLGLPYPRVAVDHGTALDLAGTSKADPSSLLAAIDTCTRLARQRRRGTP